MLDFTVDWGVEIVEAYVLYYGLKICWEAGLRTLEMETNSKLVADMLNGGIKRQNYVSNFIHDAITFFFSFSRR